MWAFGSSVFGGEFGLGQWDPMLVGEFTTHSRLPILVVGWEVHWGEGGLTHGHVTGEDNPEVHQAKSTPTPKWSNPNQNKTSSSGPPKICGRSRKGASPDLESGQSLLHLGLGVLRK